jgi:anti-sigma factor RsiW
MDCSETERLLGVYVDGELDLIRQLHLEAHLGTCSTCKKAAEAAMDFRNSVRMTAPLCRAPPELRAKIRAALRRESKPEIRWISPFRSSAVCAAAVVAVCVLGMWAWITVSRGRVQQLIAEAISDHSRSLLVEHPVDVTSSEKYTVERWFIAKLVYLPAVADLTQAGYSLVGGRLDTLEKRRVAVIVYKYQDSFINVFVWPTTNDTIAFDSQFFHGLNVCGWNTSGLNYLIVSELNQPDTEKFEDQFRERTE